jgi:hypothetical protein
MKEIPPLLLSLISAAVVFGIIGSSLASLVVINNFIHECNRKAIIVENDGCDSVDCAVHNMSGDSQQE